MWAGATFLGKLRNRAPESCQLIFTACISQPLECLAERERKVGPVLNEMSAADDSLVRIY